MISVGYPDDTNRVGAVSDSNGYTYLLFATNGASSLVYAHIIVNWYQDANATIQMGITDWTVPPQSFIVVKVPVISRFYTVEIGPVGGTTGNTINLAVYGTIADQENLLTQNTARPMLYEQQSVGAGVTLTKVLGGIFGGRVLVSVEQSSNNNWLAWIEYYDWTTQTWRQYFTLFGSAYGQSANVDAILPYAPVRFNVLNTDAVANTVTAAILAP